jgi:hypothetical protein
MTAERPQSRGACGRPTPPQPESVLVAAEAAAWPTVQLHTLTIEGEAGWRKALCGCPRATPGEVVLLLEAVAMPWFGETLVVTEPARERLRAWVEAGSPITSPADVPMVADGLDAELSDALTGLPPPVLLHLARHAVVIAVGHQAEGYCVTPPPPRVDSTEARRVLNIEWHVGADAEFRGCVLHETAHHWLEAGPPLVREPLPLSAIREARQDRATLVRLGLEWNLLARVVAPETERELRAVALARAWGGNGPGADSCLAREFTRFRVEREAAIAQRQARGA